jgi:hypothetical protein
MRAAKVFALWGGSVAALPHAAGQAVVVEDATTAVLEADDARIAATTKVDEAGLEAVLDDDLHYAHSNGVVDTKESFIEQVVSGRLKYLEYEPIEREVTFPRAGIALVRGRARVVVEHGKGRSEFTLSHLAVWRDAGGGWKFLAWQSARLPPP